MKVKALISMLSATAIIVTAGVSFAQWDQLSTTKTGVTLGVEQAAVVKFDASNVTWKDNKKLAPTGALVGGEVEGTFTINATQETELNKTGLKLTAENISLDGVNSSDISIKFFKGATEIKTDAPDTNIGATNEYTVKVALTDNNFTLAQVEALKDKNLTFDIKADAAATVNP